MQIHKQMCDLFCRCGRGGRVSEPCTAAQTRIQGSRRLLSRSQVRTAQAQRSKMNGLDKSVADPTCKGWRSAIANTIGVSPARSPLAICYRTSELRTRWALCPLTLQETEP